MRLERAVSEFMEGYFATCQRSPKTVAAYGFDLQQFRMAVPKRVGLQRVTANMLESWADELRTLGYATTSIRRKFAALRVFFNYWVRRGAVERSPLWTIRLDLAPEKRLPRVLSMEDTRTLIRHAKKRAGGLRSSPKSGLTKSFLALRDLAIVELLFATGIRIGELSSLTVRDLNKSESVLVIRGKGDRQRLAFLPDARSEQVVLKYMCQRERLTVEHATNCPFFYRHRYLNRS